MNQLPRKSAVLDLSQLNRKVKLAVRGRSRRSELLYKTIRAQMIPSGTPDVGYGSTALSDFPVGFY